jgi:hypothetical protein
MSTQPNRPVRRHVLLAAAAVLVPLLALVTASPAAAHGDPAAHFLERDLLYPAVADRPTPQTELRLLSLLHASREVGYPVRVALLADEADLTEDAGLLVDPQRCAEQLAQTLGGAAAQPGPILVVAEAGYGLAGRVPAAGQLRTLGPDDVAALLAGLPPVTAGDGEGLALTAEAAVRSLVALEGHTLPASVPTLRSLGDVAQGAQPAGRLPVPTAVLVFAATFLTLVLLYEVRRRRPTTRTY